MKEFYSEERNVQILIELLKQYNIKKIVASPGTTNIPFVGSAQSDPYFQMYSCVDERSAAYMACGISSETGEPVVLTCTGATASRNYFPGLTEAFYHRLPILAITSTRPLSRIGHHVAQVIDRTAVPNDVVKCSVFVPLGRNHDEEWDSKIKLNKALVALRKDGGGPVHINLETESNLNLTVKEISGVKRIGYITPHDEFPAVPKGRIAILLGSHLTFTTEEMTLIERFCEQHNGVVYCDHTANYHGKYKVPSPLLAGQDNYKSVACSMELMIYIGDVCGSYDSVSLMPKAKTVWRVSEDGIIRDPSGNLSNMFYMRELDFFNHYVSGQNNEVNTSFYNECRKDYDMLIGKIPSDVPLSNIWMAYTLAPKMPAGCVMHFAILNSLRAWGFFEVPGCERGYSNVGGFGIDGDISTLIGASLCDKNRLYFAVVGDLAFFYDMNVLGNRHVGPNVRILLVNNGKGMEFRNYIHPISKHSNEMVDKYISAGGHFGNKSATLVRHYAEDLGYEYMTASSKEEFISVMDRFVTPQVTKKPMLLEVFTKQDDENTALHIIRNLEKSTDKMIENMAKKVIVNTLGKEGLKNVKDFIRKR